MYVTWNTVQHGRFLHPFENIYTIFQVEVVSDLFHELWYCVGIVVNKILTKYGHFVQWNRDWFFWEFQRTVHRHHPKKSSHLFQRHCDCLFWEYQTTEHPHKPKHYMPTVQWQCDFFSGIFKQLSIVINRNILNQHIFWVWVGCRLILDDDRRLIV